MTLKPFGKKICTKQWLSTALKKLQQKKISDLDCNMKAFGTTLYGNPYSFDYDRAYRMGKPQQNRTRPVALVLLRHRDKQDLFAALAKCKEKGELKEVFINTARIEAENEKYMKLLNFAKATKEKDSTVKYRIRN